MTFGINSIKIMGLKVTGGLSEEPFLQLGDCPRKNHMQ
jgi:hypothetical protein